MMAERMSSCDSPSTIKRAYSENHLSGLVRPECLARVAIDDFLFKVRPEHTDGSVGGVGPATTILLDSGIL